MSFSRHTIITFYTRIFIAVLTFVSTIIVARTINPAGYGIYTLSIGAVSLLTVLSDLGIGMSSIYFLGRGKYALPKVVGNLIVSALGVSSIAVACFLALYHAYPVILKGVSPVNIYVVMLAVPTTILYNFLCQILLAEKKVGQYNFVLTFHIFSMLMLFLFTLILLKTGPLGAVLSWTLSSAATLVLVLFLVSRITSLRPQFDFQLFKQFLTFGIKGHMSNIATQLNYRLDSYIVNFFLGLGFTGIYGISVRMAELLWFLPTSVAIVLYPRVAYSDGDDADVFTPRICRTTFFFTLIFALVFVAFSKAIPIIFSQRYAASISPFLVLLPGIVALSFPKVLSSYIVGKGRPILTTLTSLAALVVTVVLDFKLIPTMGIIGAALASTIAYSSAAIIMLIIFLRMSGASLRDTILVKREDFAAFKKILSPRFLLSFRPQKEIE